MARKVAFVGKIQPGKRKKQYCKCNDGLVILNLSKNKSICPFCFLPKKLKSDRTKNMLKAGSELWKKEKMKKLKKEEIKNKDYHRFGSKICWFCYECNWVVISNSLEHHKMDYCQCKKCGVDLEEYHCRWLGKPTVIARFKNGKWKRARK